MLAAALASVAAAGCSKADSDAPKDNKEVSSAKDVAGIAKETVLVLKFHHDS